MSDRERELNDAIEQGSEAAKRANETAEYADEAVDRAGAAPQSKGVDTNEPDAYADPPLAGDVTTGDMP
jgi:hypothetical protein